MDLAPKTTFDQHTNYVLIFLCNLKRAGVLDTKWHFDMTHTGLFIAVKG